MSQPQPQWHIQLTPELPQEFIEAVQSYTSAADGRYAAQLLWQRGMRDSQQLAGFLNPDLYQPASPFEFGQEMKWAVKRLQKARETGEKVVIWGDFDADGITATSVLWEGLGQFFPQHQQLTYYIPNRLTESHGLNCQGIDKLAASGTKLIVTCDTGSTNLQEIDYAQKLGIDIIITDHHTLPEDRPSVVAIINPRYFVETHPLFHLSGVAVAYKLLEALYQSLPNIPKQPLADLLDLVAIGLIADLVQLSGDCRYLAQRGIQRLQQQMKNPTRPGVARLLELCQRNGDRPTDISFGLGPRINAVSRIQGDASFCVELLTSRDKKRTEELAIATELANTRRKSLQKDVTQQVKHKLAQLDLSTTSVIVLEDPQWPVGVLGLVASQIAQEYGRPTILLSTGEEWGTGSETWEMADQDKRTKKLENYQSTENNLNTPNPQSHTPLARGSARSVNHIDLYELVNSQAHLLHRFGGHPFAAGLSLPVENIPLFVEAINQQLRQQFAVTSALMQPVMAADLVVNVAALGKELFYQLKLLEPCGMGNPIPKLLLENCWFEEVFNRNTQDFKGRKVQYIKTELEIWDDSSTQGFPGIWWGHYKDEVPKGRCYCLVELDYNNYKKRPEARLVAVHAQDTAFSCNFPTHIESILDWRGEEEIGEPDELSSPYSNPLTVRKCPISWDELQLWFRRALQAQRTLAIAYPPPDRLPSRQVWEKLVGIAKFLSRTSQSATLAQLHEKLELSDRTLHLGLVALTHLGFQVKRLDGALQISWSSLESSINTADPVIYETIQVFLAAVEEEQFLQQYFYQVPLSTIQGIVGSVLEESSMRG
ncbi:MAG TPA: single-stranded-DNA-specific exonuclease RecJ [Cyanobacteria bacterium UBA8803]|nr:single-stranded-DNA-specific exonuclease RecJ [Cyanobacteria bacterium UBA9273]HBL60934.1 single-stranded-DNA-specific exonuclease RecJ [Cyanobacteria bacterium UBA8803]